jgi:nucleotide-binding universal stress UspA family protein
MATAVSVIASSNTEIRLGRLFVPVDFSPVSDRAVDYAKRIARRHEAEVVLAHVNQPVNPMAVPEAVWCHLQAAERKERTRLSQMGEQLRAEGLNARTITLNGLVQDEIPCCSQQECSDLIVLGAHIKSGIERLLFGSDTEVLFRHAGCPVLVIGPEIRPAPERDWRLDDVICASDLRPESSSTAAYAWKLAKKYGAAFTLLNVECHPAKSAAAEQAKVRFEESLSRYLPEEGATAVSKLRSLPQEHRSCPATIVAFAKERHSDLIVMGAHATTHAATRLLRGTAAQVIAESPCPVLVLNIS